MAYPRDEQETIITFDNLQNKWHLYTDVPKHIRKWQSLIKDCKITEENGEIVAIEGSIEGTVSISKKRQLTPEQKASAAERLKKARIQKGQS